MVKGEVDYGRGGETVRESLGTRYIPDEDARRMIWGRREWKHFVQSGGLNEHIGLI